MIYSLVTIVLAASGASANFFKPKFSGGSFSGRNPVPSNVPPTRVPGPNDGVRTTVSAKVECTAEAAASSLIGFTDVFASASAAAVVDVCSGKFASVPNLEPVRALFAPFAGAFALARAEAIAACQSSQVGGGKAEGCALAKAQAQAVSVAFAEAHAVAVAQAFASSCTCTNAEAFAFGEASLVLKLLAIAEAEATAVACSSGNEFAGAQAFISCYADVFAIVFARALAEATASAQCFIDGGDASATASIIAEVGADVYQYEYCDVYIFEEGPADGTVGGGSRTSVIDITRHRPFFH